MADAAPPPFSFTPREGEPLRVDDAVFQALGAASMCWSETPRGTFDIEQARGIGDALLEVIDGPAHPLRGLADLPAAADLDVIAVFGDAPE